MKKQGLMGFIQKAVDFSEKHQREILLGCTIVGVVSTGIAAWRNAPKAEKIIAKYRHEMEVLNSPAVNDLTEEEIKEEKRKETAICVKGLAPLVLPPVVLGGLTIASAVGGHTAGTKQIAALTAAYNLSKDALAEYVESTKETVGEKKEREIVDNKNIKKSKKAYEKLRDECDIIETGKGNVLFYDKYIDKFFRSSWESVKGTVNDINNDWNNGMYDDDYEIPYNDFLNANNLPCEGEFGKMFVFGGRDVKPGTLPIRLVTSVYQLESKFHPVTKEAAAVIDFMDPPDIAEEYVCK